MADYATRAELATQVAILQAQWQSLENQWRAVAAGQRLEAGPLTAATELTVGAPAWHDPAQGRLRGAQLVRNADGRYASSAAVLGLVRQRDASQAWLVTAGLLPGSGWTAALEDSSLAPVTGQELYLSALEPGRLSLEPRVGAAPIAVVAPGGLLVGPPASWQHGLRPYALSLACAPSGAPVASGTGPTRWTIPIPELSTAGWLPAGHASFEGQAPADAVWGYNLSADAAARAQWPPPDLAAVYAEWDRGGADSPGASTLIPGGLLKVTTFGIWWCDNRSGSLPWPDNPADPLWQETSGAVPEHPRTAPMKLRLWLSRPVGAADSVVSSLHGNPGIVVRCAGASRVESTGDLEVALDLDGGVDDAGTYLRGVAGFDANGRLVRVPMVMGLEAGDNVVLEGVSGPHPAGGGRTRRHGNVKISAGADLQGWLPIDQLRLEGATLETLDGSIPCTGMAAGRATAFRGMVELPPAWGACNVRLEFWLLGRSAGVLPLGALSYAARALPAPSAATGGAPTAFVFGDGPVGGLSSPASATLTAANQYVLAHAPTLAASAGAVVAFRLSRGTADGYAGEIDVLRVLARRLDP